MVRDDLVQIINWVIESLSLCDCYPVPLASGVESADLSKRVACAYEQWKDPPSPNQNPGYGHVTLRVAGRRPLIPAASPDLYRSRVKHGRPGGSEGTGESIHHTPTPTGAGDCPAPKSYMCTLFYCSEVVK
ncbi:hypothetical protein Bbelb_182570 [Branchiostoma belcheri]|nr:hypothetical protein Bbelb_182570 [Branchiostoma belcheri]